MPNLLPLRFAEHPRSVGPMLWAVLHRLIMAVTLVAFVGGMTLQLMPPQAAFAGNVMADGDCAHMAMADDAGGGSTQKAPCKSNNLPECVKQMGCLGTPSLSLRAGVGFTPVAYQLVSYSTAAPIRDGRTIKPDLLPPIGL